jgi:hypothetical protein
MKVQFLTGPRAGEITHVPRNATTQLLIDAGMVKELPETPAPVVPVWYIGTGVHSGRAHVRLQIGNRAEIYDGPPQHLAAAFKKLGFDVPAHTVAQYTARFDPQLGVGVGADQAEMFKAIRHGHDDNRKR